MTQVVVCVTVKMSLCVTYHSQVIEDNGFVVMWQDLGSLFPLYKHTEITSPIIAYIKRVFKCAAIIRRDHCHPCTYRLHTEV